MPHLLVGVEVTSQIDGGEAPRSILSVVFLDLFSRAIEEFALDVRRQPDRGDLQTIGSRIPPHANRSPAARLESFGQRHEVRERQRLHDRESLAEHPHFEGGVAVSALSRQL